MHITDQQVAALLDYRSVVEILSAAFKDMAQGMAQMHPRQRSECEGVKLSSMGAIWRTHGVAGMKVYTTLNGSFSFCVVLFDTTTNQVLAVMDGQELTRFRTAAITTLVASNVLARQPARVALIGAGVQGRAQLECLCESFQFESISIVDPMADRAWCSAVAGRWKTAVRIVEAEEAVHDADIVVTATRSAQPVFNGAWLKPGALVAAMGTSTPKNRELDDMTLDRADRIFVEWRPQGIQEAGEIAMWQQGRDLNKVHDLAQMFSEGAKAGPADITVFKSVGVGLADVAVASLAYKRYIAAQSTQASA